MKQETPNAMFCFQCEETRANHGCTQFGNCGKSPEVAKLQDELLQLLKALARKQEREGMSLEALGRFTTKSLFMTITNCNFDPARFHRQLEIGKAMLGMTPIAAPCGVLSTANEEIRSLRELLTYGIKGIAAYAHHAAVLGMRDPVIEHFILDALSATLKNLPVEELLSLIMESGDIAVKTMALLDRANVERFGEPQAVTVSLEPGTRPGILVSGHDLLDLEELLVQSEGKNLDIYTHGEMLPAHGYPALRKYAHLKGHYGNSWHLQNREFETFRGAILMTTNCITPVQDGYQTRIFTTGAAGYPGVPHIAGRIPGGHKDFSKLIALAQTLPPPEKIECGTVQCGYGHWQLEALTEKIVAAVKAGKIRRFIVMAGCDGRYRSREYYTEVARQLPPDAVILTAGCAKFRYNKLNLGEIDGIPRVIDAGQCNDSYSLALFAIHLAEVFQLKNLNELPLSFDIAWYEQKAVAVFLALLALGVKGIRLGPTLPAFLAPAVAAVLQKNFELRKITTAAEDVAAMMQGH